MSPRALALPLALCVSLCSWGLQALGADTVADAGGSNRVAVVLQRLEKHMAKLETVQSSFVQEKTLNILSRKLILEGRMFLESPGRFAWHVDKPVRYSMVVGKGVVRQWDEDTDRVQKTSISRNPMLQAVMKQFESWFSGKFSALAKEYDVSLLKDRATATLRFVPRSDAPARKAVKAVTVTLREDERYIERLELVDTSGDTTVLTFSKTVLNNPIVDGAWEVRPRD